MSAKLEKKHAEEPSEESSEESSEEESCEEPSEESSEESSEEESCGIPHCSQNTLLNLNQTSKLQKTLEVRMAKFKGSYPTQASPGQRVPEYALTKPSKLVYTALHFLLSQAKIKKVLAMSPNDIMWNWTEESWKKWIQSNCFNLAWDPQHISECWMYCNPHGSRSDGYVQTAIGGTRPLLHNVTYLLLHPDERQWLSERETGKKGQKRADVEHVSHRCHSKKGQSVCFNPWHLHRENGDINEDRKGCNYGCSAHCPHVPKCIFGTSSPSEYKLPLPPPPPVVTNDDNDFIEPPPQKKTPKKEKKGKEKETRKKREVGGEGEVEIKVNNNYNNYNSFF